MPKITQLPGNNENDYVIGSDEENGFGYCQFKNEPEEQQNVLTWQPLTADDLTPDNSPQQLSPEEIGDCLRASYDLLNNHHTSASTTVYDGKGNLITATLGNSISFVAAYDEEGGVLNVAQLVDFDTEGTSSGINITTISKLLIGTFFNVENVGNVHVINIIDGFTKGRGTSRRCGYDVLSLFRLLEQLTCPGNEDETILAMLLVHEAIDRGALGNITIGIQTITLRDNTSGFFLGVYDGHRDRASSTYASCVLKEEFASIIKSYREQDNRIFSSSPLNVYTPKEKATKVSSPKQKSSLDGNYKEMPEARSSGFYQQQSSEAQENNDDSSSELSMFYKNQRISRA